MENLRQPDPLSCDGDLSRSWKHFKNSFEVYSIATGLVGKAIEVQAAVFLHVIRQDGRQLVETVDLQVEDLKDVNKIF